EPLGFVQINQINNVSGITFGASFYGGYLLSVNSQSKIYENKNTIYGYILDNNFKINSTLDLPDNFTLPSFNQKIDNKGFYRSYTFTRNNTFIGVMPSENASTTWQIISTEITKFLPDG